MVRCGGEGTICLKTQILVTVEMAKATIVVEKSENANFPPLVALVV